MAAKLKESGKAIDITNWRDWPMYHDEPSIETTEQANERLDKEFKAAYNKGMEALNNTNRHKTVLYSVVGDSKTYNNSSDTGIVDYD